LLPNLVQKLYKSETRLGHLKKPQSASRSPSSA
jgi:hypothetical protein